MDREEATTAVEQQLAQLGNLRKQTIPYKNEKNIEQQVRTLRNIRSDVYFWRLKDAGIPIALTLSVLHGNLWECIELLS
jgi:hypothetical protein